ncbi:MAG: hypothetical protein FE78DRAFT_107262 [Acidomyces sp. 'richmondensis']|nr:MAG: hypothetical protein FE78DRAFT_107262 [Acidomyces sp. 'richmondensis']
MSAIDLAFLIENPRLGKKAIIETAIPGVRVEKDVREILQEKGMELGEINDIIWSHSHWDHTGSAYHFPPSTNLCFGKGTGPFPGYPLNADSALNAANFKNRQCMEIDYETQIEPFPAHDLYVDGSLYLLDTPGHWPGHIGDICHFAGNFRPSEDVSFPDKIPEGAFGNCGDDHIIKQNDHHPQHHGQMSGSVDPNRRPFYKLSTHHHSSYKDPSLANITTLKMQKYFDSDPNVLVCLAHDTALLDHLPTFNADLNQDLNEWKQNGMKEKCHWGWLKELPRYDKDGNVLGPGMRESPIVVGLWKNGERVVSLRT